MCSSPDNSLIEQLYLRITVIIVENVYKLGKKGIKDALDVERMVTEVEVTCKLVGKWLVRRI